MHAKKDSGRQCEGWDGSDAHQQETDDESNGLSEEGKLQSCLSPALDAKGGPGGTSIVPPTRPSVPSPQGAVETLSLLCLEPSAWLDDDALNALIKFSPPDLKEERLFGSHTWNSRWCKGWSQHFAKTGWTYKMHRASPLCVAPSPSPHW